MPGNPKECRRNAARCAELAVAAHTPQLRARFLELSKNWEKLAIQVEDAFAKLTEHEAIWSDVRESLNETRRLFPLCERAPVFAFTLDGRRMRVKKPRRPLMKQRGNFIKRWNADG